MSILLASILTHKSIILLDIVRILTFPIEKSFSIEVKGIGTQT